MKRWLAAAAALLIVLSGCARHLASSSGSESLPEESASSSGPEAIPELPVEDSFGETAYYWTDDVDRVSQLWELQHRETLTEEEALTLAEDLTEKAHYLNYLTYGEEVYREEGLVSIIRWDTDSTDGVPEKGGNFESGWSVHPGVPAGSSSALLVCRGDASGPPDCV